MTANMFVAQRVCDRINIVEVNKSLRVPLSFIDELEETSKTGSKAIAFCAPQSSLKASCAERYMTIIT